MMCQMRCCLWTDGVLIFSIEKFKCNGARYSETIVSYRRRKHTHGYISAVEEPASILVFCPRSAVINMLSDVTFSCSNTLTLDLF